MKRCENCGYENDPGLERCEKCGARLGESQGSSSAPSPSHSPEPSGGKKTVKGKAADRPYLDSPPERESAQESNAPANCPKCGYPTRPDSSACPNCGYQLAPAASAPKGGKQTIALGDFSGFGNEAKPRFELVVEKEQRSVEFSGDEVILNRDKLDPDNMTISGSEHARISFKDGKWHIEDMSSNGATFVQTRRPTEIQDGDLIILGQKIFRFKAK